MNNESERMRKEAHVAYFYIISQYLTRVKEGNHKHPKPG
jgi:hypothetical protein